MMSRHQSHNSLQAIDVGSREILLSQQYVNIKSTTGLPHINKARNHSRLLKRPMSTSLTRNTAINQTLVQTPETSLNMHYLTGVHHQRTSSGKPLQIPTAQPDKQVFSGSNTKHQTSKTSIDEELTKLFEKSNPNSITIEKKKMLHK